MVLSGHDLFHGSEGGLTLRIKGGGIVCQKHEILKNTLTFSSVSLKLKQFYIFGKDLMKILSKQCQGDFKTWQVGYHGLDIL